MGLIAYRRMSGAIGISEEEKGARGLWWEKRLALTKALLKRGHEVYFVNRLTKASQGKAFHSDELRPNTDLLFIEFGSSNMSFYGEDLLATEELLKNYSGRVVFLCDDPDLPYRWKTVPESDYWRWSCWYNAVRPIPFAGQPPEIPCFDMPFSSLQSHSTPIAEYDPSRFVYMGRPNGRETRVIEMIAYSIPWRVYGKPKEWTEFGITPLDPPNQPDRAAFYQSKLGSLVLADRKHKRLRWRTGRAYHAVLAGCPAAVEHDHEALDGFTSFHDSRELIGLAKAWADPFQRMSDWTTQINQVRADYAIALETFKAFDL